MINTVAGGGNPAYRQAIYTALIRPGGRGDWTVRGTCFIADTYDNQSTN